GRCGRRLTRCFNYGAASVTAARKGRQVYVCDGLEQTIQTGIRNRGNVVLARRQPVQTVLAEVIRLYLSGWNERTISVAIGIRERLNLNSRQRFSVLVDDAPGNRACWNQLERDVGHLLTGRHGNDRPRAGPGTLAELLTNVSVALHGDPVLSGVHV